MEQRVAKKEPLHYTNPILWSQTHRPQCPLDEDFLYWLRPIFRTRLASSAYKQLVLSSTAVAKKRLDVVTRLLLEKVTRLEYGGNEQSAASHVFLDSFCRTTEQNNHAYDSCRERPTHNDQQSQFLRVVDPINDDGVRAIANDGCKSFCHGKVCRCNAESKMKVLGSKPVWLQRKHRQR